MAVDSGRPVSVIEDAEDPLVETSEKVPLQKTDFGCLMKIYFQSLDNLLYLLLFQV